MGCCRLLVAIALGCVLLSHGETALETIGLEADEGSLVGFGANMLMTTGTSELTASSPWRELGEGEGSSDAQKARCDGDSGGKLKCKELENLNNDQNNDVDSCPDHLRELKFFQQQQGGLKGKCRSFLEEVALDRTTLPQYGFSGYDQDGEYVVSKAGVVHPNSAATNIGAIAFKRIACKLKNSAGAKTCYTYKVGYCIKCPNAQFQYTNQKKATETEKRDFILHCASNAFNSNGLKASYKCDDTQSLHFERFLLSF